jgi:hypothetical protein
MGPTGSAPILSAAGRNVRDVISLTQIGNAGDVEGGTTGQDFHKLLPRRRRGLYPGPVFHGYARRRAKTTRQAELHARDTRTTCCRQG